MMSLGLRYPFWMCSNNRGHWRFTGHWFIRKVRPLFIASPNLTALNNGPYAPTTDTVPPLRTESIAQFRAIGDPPCKLNFAAVTCCRKFAIRFRADRVDHPIGAEEARRLLHLHDDVGILGKVECLRLRETPGLSCGAGGSRGFFGVRTFVGSLRNLTAC